MFYKWFRRLKKLIDQSLDRISKNSALKIIIFGCFYNNNNSKFLLWNKTRKDEQYL